MNKGAYISQDGLYRYTLWRDWSNGKDTRAVAFVGLNPSTADAEKDDPTIRRCIGFAQSWGFNKLIMVNLFAFRATNPKEMMKAEDPEGPENKAVIKALVGHADVVIAAWGTHGDFRDQGSIYVSMLDNPYHLGLTKDGHPKHPLYLRSDARPQPFGV